MTYSILGAHGAKQLLVTGLITLLTSGVADIRSARETVFVLQAWLLGET